MSYTSDHARLGPDQADRAPSPSDLAADQQPTPANTPGYRCRKDCGARMWSDTGRTRHEARCDGQDPWT